MLAQPDIHIRSADTEMQNPENQGIWPERYPRSRSGIAKDGGREPKYELTPLTNGNEGNGVSPSDDDGDGGWLALEDMNIVSSFSLAASKRFFLLRRSLRSWLSSGAPCKN
jgi:hypothetical protein